MGYLADLRAAANRWLSSGNLLPIRGAKASADGKSVEIDPAAGGVEASLRSAAYWACTRLISTSIGSLPSHVYEETTDGKVKAKDHPQYRLLTMQPNPWMTMPEYIQATVMNLLCWGNAYTLPDAIGGEVVGLYPLSPERMTMFWQPDGTLAYRYVDVNGRTQTYQPGELLHFRVYTLDGILGLSPLDYHRMNFNFEVTAGSYASNIYRNGGRPSGVLEFPTAKTDEQKVKIRDSWQSLHGGPMNVGAVAILDGGVKYSPISVPLDQMSYIDSQQFTVEQIARIFGVPPHLIGASDHPTYASVEQQSIEFLRYTIQPLVIALERTIQSHLLVDPYIFRFNLAGFERSDIKTRYSAYAIGRQWGFLSVNDIRNLEEMNSIPEGDVYLQPLNMVNASADTAAEQPVEPGITPGGQTP